MESEFYKQVGRRIAAFRREKGWNQYDLGREAKVSPSHVAHIEAATRRPTLEMLRRFATALDVPAWRLLAERRVTAGEQEWKRKARDLSMLVDELSADDLLLLISVAQRLRSEPQE